MKKLMILMVAISLCVIGSGNAWATNPVPSIVDNHAVWTKWFDDNGHRLPGTYGVTGSTPGVEKKISTQSLGKGKMKGRTAEFDYIHETKVYDYAKDRGNSA